MRRDHREFPANDKPGPARSISNRELTRMKSYYGLSDSGNSVLKIRVHSEVKKEGRIMDSRIIFEELDLWISVIPVCNDSADNDSA